MDSFLDSFINFEDTRPTLPPLHSLNLPIPKISQGRGGTAFMNRLPINDLNDFTYVTPNKTPICPQKGVASNSSATAMSSSSSNTCNSRTPSPVPSDSSLSSASTSQSMGAFRLVPCEIKDADAVVVVTETVAGSGRGRAMLLVGPAAQPYRQPSSRPIAKNSRVHPYKFAPTQHLTRRLSTLSISSQLN
ncbi:hypothetical protein D9756_006467 [Leucocoprinus leucothites]|uniref:Uncharacterized protein n=1 Tax=Leucocoprinus leucothites TaxID=201217 RepID=A0A8H5G1Y0_9AGAR|nr:hypothetical protein D9756_006467 [Leucoagaricus leucothites]